ncbi:MAG: valine--tRNA ligase [Oligoflexia bacterium]|nr:valine--tRNA ligase [Oligoflexia bacterium]
MGSASRAIPLKYSAAEAEAKWRAVWDENGLHRWDPKIDRAHTFVVDTPPPTVSGSLHVGHVFSYTQTDVVVRYQRMLGKNIFYPIGWDDNGLPTERRVQNYFGIRCAPHLPYDPNWKPSSDRQDKDKVVEISRRNFIEACAILTAEDEKAFEKLWRTVGLSVDWSLQYATIDKHCQRISQLSFLDLVAKGEVYNTVAPTMWDVDFRSAISQAEVEDREIGGHFHDISFEVEGGGDFTIATTRPELLPACIAVVAHPDDARYQKFFGKRAYTPLFEAPVPIVAAEHADPEKGSGILMVCTFGDIMDVQWWRKSGLPARQVIGLDGRIVAPVFGNAPFDSRNPARANSNMQLLAGLTVKQAQKKIVELLAHENSSADGKHKALLADPKPIMHPVKFYEKGDRPLEFIPTRQWFQKILDHKEALLAQGRKVEWHPAFMQTRYEHWVQGLNQDWCLSRQRYFGVPFPVWYPIDKSGAPDYGHPLYADKAQLPIDPLTDCPTGYSTEQRDKPGGFTGDPDVMDTWATSCVTPQIASHWQLDPARHHGLFPMDVRPQAHDIIRTWAFYTIVRAWNHEGQIPWKNALISGFIVDKDRKKMSKSKGNVTTPEGLLTEHSADAVRYWASRARLGVDTAFDKKLFEIGNKLCTKLFNAAKFVVGHFDRTNLDLNKLDLAAICEPLDLALVEKLRTVISEATRNFDRFDYAVALQGTEDAFWNFCDHYLELIKVRAYSESDSTGRASALATLGWSIRTFIKLFAPVVPFVTEEIWSWTFAGEGRDCSVHTSSWPTIEEVENVERPANAKAFDAALELTGKIRGAKTAAQKSLRWEVKSVTATGSSEAEEALRTVLADVLSAGNVVQGGFKFVRGEAEPGQMFNVSVILAEQWVAPARDAS